MQFTVDLTVIAFIAGMVSLIVGVLAMILSVQFYLKSNDLVLETTRTLGEIRQTTMSLEESVRTIISRTIDYLMGGTVPSQANLKKATAMTEEMLERVKAESSGTELGKNVEELAEALKHMREEYAASIQSAERRRALAVPSVVESEKFPLVSSKEDYIDIWINRGWDLYLAGDFDGSIEASRRALRMDPDNPYAGPNLALALLRKGEKQAALAQYKRFIDHSPRTRYIWLAVKDLEDIRGLDVDGLEDALQMLVSATEVADTPQEGIPPEDEILS